MKATTKEKISIAQKTRWEAGCYSNRPNNGPFQPGHTINSSIFEGTRKKMSIAQRGKRNPGVAEYNKSRPKDKHPMYGKKRPDMAGENSNFWKGGITPLKRAIRTMGEYNRWRENIFKRDDYTCQECGDRGVYLHVDHYPIPFAELIKVNNITNLEEACNCRALWNQDNGRTVCKKCHYRITFGKDMVRDVPFGVNKKFKKKEAQNTVI